MSPISSSPSDQFLRHLLAVVVAAQCLLGCATLSPQAELRSQAAVRVAEVPFVAQAAYQCGPAALAMLLQHADVQVAADELTPSVYLPERRGSLQAELIAAARQRQRMPIKLGPELADLHAALADGYPVLVFQNLALSWWPQWHYAVLLGMDPAAGQARMHSGPDADRSVELPAFLRSWALADRWAIVVASTEKIPEFARPKQWLRAAADFEALGHHEQARQAYFSAAQRWPDLALPWRLLGNVALLEQDPAGALMAYREAQLRAAHDVATLNNVAMAHALQGCKARALQALAQARTLDQGVFAAALQQTATELAAMPAGECSDA